MRRDQTRHTHLRGEKEKKKKEKKKKKKTKERRERQETIKRDRADTKGRRSENQRITFSRPTNTLRIAL